MDTSRQRWLPARLVRRWGALLVVGPLVGLLAGLTLVFVFLKKNRSDHLSVEAGLIPSCVDGRAYLAELGDELGSEATLIAVQRRLADKGLGKRPLWWLRSRIVVRSTPASMRQHWGYVDVEFTHHSFDGLRALREAFSDVSTELVPRVRMKHQGAWIPLIDARLREIDEAYHAAAAEREIFYRKDIPFVDERDELEDAREFFSEVPIEDQSLGEILTLPGTFFTPPWWKSEWALFIVKCTGYGLMSALPVILVFEALWPRREKRLGQSNPGP